MIRLESPGGTDAAGTETREDPEEGGNEMLGVGAAVAAADDVDDDCHVAVAQGAFGAARETERRMSE